MTDRHPDEDLFDPWTREYALLGLRMDRIAPGTVDGWLGPPQWRDAVLAEDEPDPRTLHDAASALLDRLPGLQYPRQREEYLLRQVQALRAMASVLAGEVIPLAEQARLFFDIHPEREPDATFEAAHQKLDAVLPGSGPLGERMQTWRRSLEMSPEQLKAGIGPATDEVRTRTKAHLALPDEESVEVVLVQNEPWGAYNWYLGNARSRIEVNTDVPQSAAALVDYIAHEGYPGHHTEHVLREMHQYRGQQHAEYSILLINTPESVISEAIATCALDLLFEEGRDLHWLATEVLPGIGIELDAVVASRIREAGNALRGVSGNAAFLLHEDGRTPEEVSQYIQDWGLVSSRHAQKHVEFLATPLWRVYTFTYRYGFDLLHPLLQGPDRFSVYERIATEPIYPSLLAEWGTNESRPTR